jgi:hypothetical protein
MTAVGLNHYNIRVPPGLLEPVKDFYGRLLNLVPGPRPQMRSHGYWLYANNQAIVHLSISRDDLPTATPATGWLDHVALSCRDLPGTIERLKAMDIDYRYAASPSERLVQLFVQDPAGLHVELNFADCDPIA